MISRCSARCGLISMISERTSGFRSVFHAAADDLVLETIDIEFDIMRDRHEPVRHELVDPAGETALDEGGVRAVPG